MNEFIEKLIGRLEEEKAKGIYDSDNVITVKDAYGKAITIVNELAEEHKDKSGIIDDVKSFLQEKFDYCAEQAEIWMDGSEKDSYFRNQKELYMDRANIYGEVMREIGRLEEEYKGGWIPCSERLPEEDGEDVLVWFEYFRYGEYNGLYQRMGISYTFKGDWSGFVNGQSGWSQLKILAWQPLPEPYQPKGE